MKISLKPLLLIWIISSFALFPTLFNDFTNWDDPAFILENPLIYSLRFENIITIFRTILLDSYHPLPILSFALEYKYFNLDPFYYHLNNLILHLLVTSLVFIFSRQLGFNQRTSVITALLFGIHPMHVESFAWITQRKDVLYASFYMSALCSYLKFQSTKKRAYYFLSLLAGLLSLLSKPMAISLPLILLLCDYFKNLDLKPSYLINKIPFFLISGLIGLLTYLAQARIPFDGILQSFIIWNYSFCFYLQKFIAPFSLNPLYELPNPISFDNPSYIWSTCLFVFVICWFVKLRKNKVFTFAWMFYFLSIFFLLRFDGQDQVILADRYMYLPSVGFCLLVGYLVSKALSDSKVNNVNKYHFLILTIAIVTIFLTYKSFKQTKVWKNSLTLWSEVIKKSNTNSVAYLNRGSYYLENGKYQLAIQDLNKALEINPKSSLGFNLRGLSLYRLNQKPKALFDFKKSIELNPNFEEPYINLSMLLINEGEVVTAHTNINKALEINHLSYQAHNQKGIIYYLENKIDLAIISFSKSLELQPNSSEVYTNRGAAYFLIGELDRAINDLNMSISINPKNAKAYLNRSAVLRSKELHNQAINDLKSAKNILKESLIFDQETLQYIKEHNSP